jgi:hypothetical protein
MVLFPVLFFETDFHRAGIILHALGGEFSLHRNIRESVEINSGL